MAAEKTEDVEMQGDENKEVENKEKSQEEKDALTFDEIKEQIFQIEKTVSSKENRYLLRVLRSLNSTRRKCNHNVLRRLINLFCLPTSKSELNEFLEKPDPESSDKPRPKSTKLANYTPIPEVDVFIHLLVLLHCLDNKVFERAVRCADALTNKITSYNRRTLDPLAAACFFHYSRSYEALDRLKEIRGFLLGRLRNSTLHHDEEGQATILNLLLRNYLHYNLFDQADKLVSKSTFPESASNNEWARFLYYLGLIKAIQLDYSEADKNLMNAIRKAPQSTAVGFKQHVHRLSVVVQLLLGEIPDIKTFREAILKKTLAPYLQLTQAVRTGDLKLFNSVIEEYKEKFHAEKTFTLIIRLRHNVIKTGIRMISLSYSRISLSDIAKKLLLDGAEDAEFIVSKAIRDGVIEATINHSEGYVQSKENIDVYSTTEPLNAFHQRVSFCLDIYNQSIKAMRYPPKAYNKNLETLEEQREREKQDLEYAKEIADEEDDFL
ncbi:26S proteasome non-ATPase regulatory subunit 3-like [Rhopilema esculentum]|uniref:26S proteasome non-ATPase regulatory subunit 3-like n=1 Tax=Rhopilema esculentum TaxID=499914 RepID=UPI0031D8D0F9